MIKMLQKIEIEGLNLNLSRTIYDKPTANTILNDQNQKACVLTHEQDKDAHYLHSCVIQLWNH